MRDLLDRTLGPLVQVSLDLSTDGAAVMSDPTQLEMAVLNLAINARDAMPEGGAIVIATRPRVVGLDPELPPGDYLEIAVADSGSGMPPEVAARAFEPFFTTKGLGRGTGLGLSQVYGIAKQSGGTARIETQEGAGTTVRLILPRTEAAADAEGPEDRRSTAALDFPVSILVVDDDEDVRRVLVEALETLAARVASAADGAAALGLLARERPDLLVVDYAMPGMTGAELAREARDRWPGLPVVFATGYADSEAIEQVLGHEARILRKPFRIEDLRAVVTEALGGGRGATRVARAAPVQPA
jgi:CheY-like chemotaxis protein